MKLLIKAFQMLCIIISIQSCGGDSQPVAKREINNNINIISLDVEQPLLEQTEILITGNVSNSSRANLNYQWRQTAGTEIKLTSENKKTAILTIPELSSNQTISLELVITDGSTNTSSLQKELTLLYVNTPPTIEVDNQLTVNSQTEVVLTSNISDEEGVTTAFWRQKSGRSVQIISPEATTLQFTAPNITTEEKLEFELTATDTDNSTTTAIVTITILPATIDIPEHVLLLTNERITNVKHKISRDNTAWTALENKIANYFTQIPYNAGEYAGSFALAFYITDDLKYIYRAIELLEHAYFSEPDIGWQYYNNRNLFRVNARWAIMGYTWIKSYISQEQQIKIENILTLWSNYWLEHVDFYNNYENFRIEDTDNLTSLAENLTLLGYALKDSPQHTNLSLQLLSAGDALLSRFVVDYYMNDIMAGGAWAEGSDYSPNTQRHWIRTFMINKDQRNIPYPTSYAQETLQALIHQTLANYSGVYKYGSEEAATDYDMLSQDYRYEFALELMGLLEDEKDLSQLYQWFNSLLAKEGFKKGSMITNFQRLLFHDPLFASDLPAFPQNTLNVATGVGLVSARTDWSENSTNLYFINRKLRVDHEHKDALSFDLAFQGKWISKESTGYSGASTTSTAHNTILIENASNDGSSSPTSRPSGDPSFYDVFNNDDITIISADATRAYNMDGYFATNYAKQVNRQIAFIKPSTVIVYDHIVTDKSETKDLIQYSDLGLASGESHTRWVKLIQHVQAKPAIIEEKLNSYQVISEDNKLVYQVHWPLSTVVNIVDEKEIWADSLEYQMPENQKKWHFEVTNGNPVEDNEFITTLAFGENLEGVSYAIDPIIMTKENGLILYGNIKGLALQYGNDAYIVLFSQTPHLTMSTVDFVKPTGFESAQIYTVGFNLEN
mgnify:CR=1 FL=1